MTEEQIRTDMMKKEAFLGEQDKRFGTRPVNSSMASG